MVKILLIHRQDKSRSHLWYAGMEPDPLYINLTIDPEADGPDVETFVKLLNANESTNMLERVKDAFGLWHVRQNCKLHDLRDLSDGDEVRTLTRTWDFGS